MIKKLSDLLMYMFKGSSASLLRSLHNLIPENILEEQIKSLKDWRDLVRELSVKLKVSEDALWFRIADDMGLSYVERVPPCNLMALPENLSVSLLRQSALIPLIKNGRIINVICVDPKRARALNLGVGNNSYVLAPWSAIARALDESEQIAKHLTKDSGGSGQVSLELSLGQRLLKKIIEEVMAYSSTDVVFEFLADKIKYSFLVSEGRTLNGEIDVRVTSELLHVFTQKLVGSEASLPKNVRPKVEFLAGSVTQVRLSWGRAPGVSVSDEGDLPLSKIVVIDDSPVFGKVVSKYLGSHNFNCECFTSARSAVSWIVDNSKNVGAVICDMHMPEVDGIKVFKEIKGDIRLKDIPVIAITSSKESSLEIEALKLGVDAFITKDEEPEIILLHVRRLTNQLEVA